MSRKQVMNRMRMQVMLVRRLGEQVKELTADGVRSPKMDGMPRGAGGTARGLDARVEKREAMERLLRRESERLLEYESEARREMDGMKPEHYMFCTMYYIGGMTMEETTAAMDRSLRQCARYKQEIEAA